MQSKTLVIVPNGKVWATSQQADTLDALSQTRKGGFARLYGYRPASNYEVSPVQDIVMVTRFSTEKLYERKRKALNAITFADVAGTIDNAPKLSALSTKEQVELFNVRLQEMVASLSKTLDGDRSDAYRQGHDRCYLNIAEGVKVNFVTVKGSDGLMQPVLTDGFPTVASIMVTYLENSRVTRVDGVRKVVNSGAPKLMSNAIESVLNKRSVGLKTASLKEDNFERLVIDNEVVLSEDVAGLV
jgi:hypothetical protein